MFACPILKLNSVTQLLCAQLFFESKTDDVIKLLGQEGDLVDALKFKSGTGDLRVAVGT